MSDEQQQNESSEQQKKHDGQPGAMEHPWVVAALGSQISPAPVPTSVALDSVTMTNEEGTTDAAILTVVDPTGIKTVLLSPGAVYALTNQGADILNEWAQEQKGGLVVADKNMERAARAAADAQNRLRSV
jgi:hypothetical protein